MITNWLLHWYSILWTSQLDNQHVTTPSKCYILSKLHTNPNLFLKLREQHWKLVRTAQQMFLAHVKQNLMSLWFEYSGYSTLILIIREQMSQHLLKKL